jgi:hypothetical protein
MATTMSISIMKPMNSVLRYVYVPRFAYRGICGCVVAILVMIPKVSMGTCIVVAATHSQIIIGADGKQARGDDPSSFRLACKINRGRGGFYWAASSPYYLDLTTGFDVERIINSVDRRSSLNETLRAIVATMRKPLIKELGVVKTAEPDNFNKIVSGKKQILQIVIVGREKGIPSFAWTYFSAKFAGNQLTVEATPMQTHRAGQDEVGFIALGEFDHAIPYLRAHTGALLDHPAETIKKAITVEAQASSWDVGPPISILRIGVTEVKWEEKGECDNKK